MLRNPRIGQAVTVHHAARTAHLFPHHARGGVVAAFGPGPGPRNVLVRFPPPAAGVVGEEVVIPRGNLNAGDVWAPNPCGCGGCSVCGMYGPKLAVMSADDPVPVTPPPAEKPKAIRGGPRKPKQPVRGDTPSLFGAADE